MLAGSPTSPPQRVGIAVQSSLRLGRTPTLRPTRAAATTIAAAAAKSGGALSIRLDVSSTHSLTGSGTISSLSGRTLGSLISRGTGSGQGSSSSGSYAG